MDTDKQIAEQQAFKIKRRLDAQPAQAKARAARIQSQLDRGIWVRPGTLAWLARWGAKAEAPATTTRRKKGTT